MVVGGSGQKWLLKIVTTLDFFPRASANSSCSLACSSVSPCTLYIQACFLQCVSKSWTTPGVSKSSLGLSSWILFSPLRALLLWDDEGCSWLRKYFSTRLHANTPPLFKFIFLSVHWKTKYSSSPASKPVFTDVQQSCQRHLIPFLTPWIWYSCCQRHRLSVVQHSAHCWYWAHCCLAPVCSL